MKNRNIRRSFAGIKSTQTKAFAPGEYSVMVYDNTREAVFLNRPNRFIANIRLEGRELPCHVKNTGRCRELLRPEARVIVEMSDAPGRKTGCDLIAVYKGERLINMDAQAPNKVFGQWLGDGGLGFVPEIIRPECTYEDSRFDFYYEHGDRRYFTEVKGVTLEEEGIVRFPDAPTIRGVKHIHGLIRALSQGFEASIVFVVQMRGVKYFQPNRATDRAFADALLEARAAGVGILAYDCDVWENGLSIHDEVEIRL